MFLVCSSWPVVEGNCVAIEDSHFAHSRSVLDFLRKSGLGCELEDHHYGRILSLLVSPPPTYGSS